MPTRSTTAFKFDTVTEFVAKSPLIKRHERDVRTHIVRGSWKTAPATEASSSTSTITTASHQRVFTTNYLVRLKWRNWSALQQSNWVNSLLA